MADDERIPFSDKPESAPEPAAPPFDPSTLELEVAREDLPKPENGGLPMVEGHAVTLPEWRAFAAYHSTEGKIGDMVAAAAAAASVVDGTINEWRRKPWWSALFDAYVDEEQQALHSALLLKRHKAAKFVDAILDGTLGEEHARYANAGMTAVSLLTRVGKRPLQDSRTVNQIQNNTLNNSGEINVDARRIENSSSDDLMKMITGEIPIPQE